MGILTTPMGKTPENSIEKKGKPLQDSSYLGQSRRYSTNLSKISQLGEKSLQGSYWGRPPQEHKKSISLRDG